LGLEQPMSSGQYLSIDEEMDAKNINDEEIVSLVNLPFSNEEDEIE
ncbi:4511_t:CDS:1, partial [Paraglomus occultum]